MFGSFLALCRSGFGCGRATGFLTWENRRRERKCDLMLRNYATFEGAFAHAYTSHGRIQGLLTDGCAGHGAGGWGRGLAAWGNAGESPALYQEPYTLMNGLAVAQESVRAIVMMRMLHAAMACK